MEINLKRKLGIGAITLAAAAFGGGAYAATQGSGGNSRQAFLADVAKRLNVSPQVLTAAIQGAFADQLAAAVKAGQLTQAEADQIKQHAQQDGVPPFGGLFFGRRGGPFFGPPQAGFGIGGGLAGAAKYLGLTPAQLREQLAAGKSPAQIADAQHKSVAGLKAAITADVRARLDQAVAAKELTSSDEQQLLSRLSASIDALVNQSFGTRRFFGRGRSFGPVVPGALPAPDPGTPPDLGPGPGPRTPPLPGGPPPGAPAPPAY